MRKYRQTSYYTISGVRKLIDLGDSTYGEWVIYNDGVPKYHINCFNKDSSSDNLIKRALDNKTETIESIINKINNKQGTKLSFSKRPLIEFVKNSGFVELELSPIPENWVENI